MTHSEPRDSRGAFQLFLLAACAVLAVLVVVLAWQNLSLKKTVERLNAAVPAAGAVGVGDTLGEVLLIDESGDEHPLTFDGNPEGTLLLVFSTRCPACTETLPFWSELHASAGEASPRVLGIRLNEATGDAIVPFPVYGIDQARSAGLAKVPYIPATLLVDGRGVISQVWYGVPDASQREAMTRVMSGS